MVGQSFFWSHEVCEEIKMEVIKPCFVCQSRDYSQEFSGRAVNGHILFKCNVCGMVTAEACDINATCDYSNYGDYLIEGNPEKQLAKTKRHYRPLFGRILKQYGAQASILDVGCGAGFFVKAARDFGFHAVGVEPSERLRAFAMETFGLESFTNVSDVEGTFDVVTMIEVIEHIHSAMNREAVCDMLKKLTEGGIFYGSTPNFNSLNIKISKENDRVVWPPQHCSYFNPVALDKYLSSMGLRKKSLYTSRFEGFRRDKNEYSFIESPPNSEFARFAVIYPLKIIIFAVGMVAGQLGKGHGIYFLYQKD